MPKENKKKGNDKYSIEICGNSKNKRTQFTVKQTLNRINSRAEKHAYTTNIYCGNTEVKGKANGISKYEGNNIPKCHYFPTSIKALI